MCLQCSRLQAANKMALRSGIEGEDFAFGIFHLLCKVSLFPNLGSPYSWFLISRALIPFCHPRTQTGISLLSQAGLASAGMLHTCLFPYLDSTPKVPFPGSYVEKWVCLSKTGLIFYKIMELHIPWLNA